MIEFDEAKRQANLAKHGCDFLIAEAFDWATAITTVDDRRDYNEVRLVAIGFIGPSLYTLIYTERGENIRVISLRPSNRKERHAYEEADK